MGRFKRVKGYLLAKGLHFFAGGSSSHEGSHVKHRKFHLVVGNKLVQIIRVLREFDALEANNTKKKGCPYGGRVPYHSTTGITAASVAERRTKKLEFS
jgi:hypothetical protein